MEFKAGDMVELRRDITDEELSSIFIYDINATREEFDRSNFIYEVQDVDCSYEEGRVYLKSNEFRYVANDFILGKVGEHWFFSSVIKELKNKTM